MQMMSLRKVLSAVRLAFGSILMPLPAVRPPVSLRSMVSAVIDLSWNNIYEQRAEGLRDGAYPMIVKRIAKATFRDDRTSSSNKHFLQFQFSILPE